MNDAFAGCNTDEVLMVRSAEARLHRTAGASPVKLSTHAARRRNAACEVGASTPDDTDLPKVGRYAIKPAGSATRGGATQHPANGDHWPLL
jgi:hypothetical protein